MKRFLKILTLAVLGLFAGPGLASYVSPWIPQDWSSYSVADQLGSDWDKKTSAANYTIQLEPDLGGSVKALEINPGVATWGALVYNAATYSTVSPGLTIIIEYGKERAINGWNVQARTLDGATSVGGYFWQYLPSTHASILYKAWQGGVCCLTPLDSQTHTVASATHYWKKVVQVGSAIDCYMSDDGSTWSHVHSISDSTYTSGYLAFSQFNSAGGKVYIISMSVDDNQTPTATFTPAGSLTDSPTITQTITVTPTSTISPTHTHTPTVLATDTPEDTFTFTPTISRTFTVSPTNTPRNTDTPENTKTITQTFTSSPTVTPSSTFTLTITPTPTDTDTPEDTAEVTFTFTPTISPTRTATPTNTASTNTPEVTFTFTPTITRTFTVTPTDTPADEDTPEDTFTDTPTFTPTPTSSPTNTRTVTKTHTVTPEDTDTPLVDDTFTFTPTSTKTPSPTATPSTSPTPTATTTQSCGIYLDSSSSGSSAGSSLTWSQLVRAWDSGVLLAGIIQVQPTSEVTAVTYNGQAMTRLEVQGTSEMYGEIWYLTAPPLGVHNVIVTTAGNAAISGISLSYGGVASIGTLDTDSAAASSYVSSTVTTATDYPRILSFAAQQLVAGLTSDPAATDLALEQYQGPAPDYAQVSLQAQQASADLAGSYLVGAASDGVADGLIMPVELVQVCPPTATNTPTITRTFTTSPTNTVSPTTSPTPTDSPTSTPTPTPRNTPTPRADGSLEYFCGAPVNPTVLGDILTLDPGTGYSMEIESVVITASSASAVNTVWNLLRAYEPDSGSGTTWPITSQDSAQRASAGTLTTWPNGPSYMGGRSGGTVKNPVITCGPTSCEVKWYFSGHELVVHPGESLVLAISGQLPAGAHVDIRFLEIPD